MSLIIASLAGHCGGHLTTGDHVVSGSTPVALASYGFASLLLLLREFDFVRAGRRCFLGRA